MKKILFPTDFSPAAHNAYVYALRLAQAMNAKMITLHAYDIPMVPTSGLNNTINDFVETMEMEEFDNYRSKLPELEQIARENNLTNIRDEHVLERGDPERVIANWAKKEEADLIVMGTTGASGIKEVFFGSVAGEVMENAPCPVLAVPDKAKFDGRINKLIFTTDYKPADQQALHWLMEWNKLFGAQIEVLHVDLNHVEELAHKMDQFKAGIEENQAVKFTVMDHTDFKKAINEHLVLSPADMLCMVIKKRNFWQELFHVSRTKQMSYHQDMPVLSLPLKMFKD